jgi:hypothetical protein
MKLLAKELPLGAVAIDWAVHIAKSAVPSSKMGVVLVV